MPEVNRRLCMARSTIENMTTILKSQTICKSLKLRIARATAFAVATHGCESWAYSKKVTKKIEAFEMWTYRRLLRVSWRQHKTNACILEQLRTKPMLVKQMRKRKMKHFGHIIRHNSLEKTIIQGITAGKRGRGRPARTWEKDIEEWAGTNIGEATRMAERRICGALSSTSQQLNIEPSEQREGVVKRQPFDRLSQLFTVGHFNYSSHKINIILLAS